MASATSKHDAAEQSDSAQAIEYIEDLIYLASFPQPPTARTPFPYIKKKVVVMPSSSSRSSSSRTPRKPIQKTVLVGPRKHPPVYFNIKDTLLYNPFYHDFGPLHIGHLYRFAVMLHEVLGDPANKGHGVVIWTLADDSRGRANAACMLACYMVLIQHWPPHLALAPLAQMDPPCMPFRDAGYSQADYILTIQDVVYGVWKAKEEAVCCLKDFCLEEYETFERVDMGDFNWITPHFLAFASPQYPNPPSSASSTRQAITDPNSPSAPQSSPASPALAAPATTIEEVLTSDLPVPFKNVLVHFKIRNIGLVVRLNSELYPATYFSSLGMEHLDMIFPDGTCPSLELVRQFVNLAHEVITVRGQNIAVHCKAGLGRTGCLIGAYLIYRHGFTANEIIAFMRFMRPGMVVGPQQHWLHINQGVFREWWFEDCMREKLAAAGTGSASAITSQPATPSKTAQKLRRNVSSSLQLSTPPPNGVTSSSKRSALGEIHANDQGPFTPNANGTKTPVAKSGITTSNDENLPAPTPGQPRKAIRQNGAENTTSSSTSQVKPQPSSATAAAAAAADREPVTLQGRLHRRDSETDEEFYLRLLSRRSGASTRRTSGLARERERRRIASSGNNVNSAVPTPSEGAMVTDDMNSSLVRHRGSLNGGSGVSTWKTRASPVRKSTTDVLGSVSVISTSTTTITGKTMGGSNGVRKTSRRVGSYGSAVWAK